MPEVTLRLRLSSLEGFEELYSQLEDLSPVISTIGEILRSSVLQNFSEQGRPEKWQPLKPETIAQKGSSLILIDTGRLLGSIRVNAGRDYVAISAPVPYAKAHQEGDPSRGLPARPYLLVQDEDLRAISEALNTHLCF